MLYYISSYSLAINWPNAIISVNCVISISFSFNRKTLDAGNPFNGDQVEYIYFWGNQIIIFWLYLTALLLQETGDWFFWRERKSSSHFTQARIWVSDPQWHQIPRGDGTNRGSSPEVSDWVQRVLWPEPAVPSILEWDMGFSGGITHDQTLGRRRCQDVGTHSHHLLRYKIHRGSRW